MRKAFVVIVFMLLSAIASQAVDIKDLPEKYRLWLDEEVFYIITPHEREVFLSLLTDKDRDFFTEAFWAQRDPTPGTPSNEFRDEHYRRIGYANTYFIDSPRKGWKTDRGRVYIILGKPRTIERFEETLALNPVEVWFYSGMTEYGFPAGFNVMFYKRHGIGEYKLYHPGSDGPASLFRDYKGDATNTEQVYEDMKLSDATLAEYSLSLLPGSREDRMGAALNSEFLLKNIATYPFKLIDPRYADKVTKYKEQIETDYSLAFMDCQYFVRVTRSPEGIHFINYSVSPRRLSIDQYEKKFYASFKIYGKIEDKSGKVIHEFTKTHPIELDQVTLDMVKANSLTLADMFPVIPGEYKLTLLVRNIVSKEFSDLEMDLEVPAGPGAALLDAIVTESVKDATAGSMRPFQFGGSEPDLKPASAFLHGSSLSAVFQTAGSVDGLKIAAEIVAGAGVTVGSVEKPAAGLSRGGTYVLSLPSAGLESGDYTVQLKLKDAAGKVVASKQLQFSISPTTTVPNPWIYSKVIPADKQYVYSLIIADQYARKNDEAGAFAAYQEGAEKHPDVPEFKVGLAKFLLQKKDYDRVISLLQPLAAADQLKTPEAHLYLATGLHARGRYAEAVERYSAYTNMHGTDYRILNAIGECYLAGGQTAEAVKIWKQSLGLYADQPALKTKLDGLTK